MYTTLLLKSTITEDTRTKQGDDKTLPVLWLEILFHTNLNSSSDHLGLTGLPNGSRKVKQCKSYEEHIECHTQVVKDLKETDEYEKI